MKILQLTILSATLAIAHQAYSDPITYDLSFTGGGTTANGNITVNNGVATGGYLDITSGPAAGDYSLYTWTGGGGSSVRVDGGTDLIVDNLVNAGSNPFLDADGLAFVSAAQIGGQPAEGIDFSLDSGTTYNLAGFGIDGYLNPNVDGTASLAVVPDTASTASLLGLSFGTIAFIGRRKAAAKAG